VKMRIENNQLIGPAWR